MGGKGRKNKKREKVCKWEKGTKIWVVTEKKEEEEEKVGSRIRQSLSAN